MKLFLEKYNSDINVLKPKLNEDIYEHLSTLKAYASKCETIINCGVKKCYSPWALIYGLLENNKNKKIILLNDINPTDNINELYEFTKNLSIEINYEWNNNLLLNIDKNYDMIFIDTWHVYGQLKRELDKFSKHINKYIIMHDTEIDGIYGESLRCKMDYKKQSIDFNIPEEEIIKGLKPAIEEFLNENKNWIIDKHFTNNNGLTILKKI